MIRPAVQGGLTFLKVAVIMVPKYGPEVYTVLSKRVFWPLFRSIKWVHKS